MNVRTLTLATVGLGGLLACGGHGGSSALEAPPQAASLTSDTALALVAPFLNEENNQTGENDGSGPIMAGEALGLAEPAPPACVAVSGVTATSVTWTFSNCTGPHGWTWNGVVVISWEPRADGTVVVRHDQRHLVGSKDGRSWDINGVKVLARDRTGKLFTLSAQPGFTKTYREGAQTTVFAYACALTADWSTLGQRKLSGSWSLTPQGGGDAVGAAIPATTPLVWDRSANCCYPVSGTLHLTRGGQTATLVHALPCGTVTVNGEAKVLPACSR